jgi:uncharacterized protein YodC (DUF2158 family)
MGLENGDVVGLKSGGPPMTISKVNAGGGNHACQWFTIDYDGNWTLHDGVFDPASLMKVEPSGDDQLRRFGLTLNV